MGVKVFKNQDGEIMVQGIPAGYWVFVTFGIIIMLIGWAALFASNILGGTIITSIGIIVLLLGKRYGNSKRQKKVNEYVQAHKQENKSPDWMNQHWE